MIWKGQPLEDDGGRRSSSVHQQIEGIERATEERNAQVLTAFDDHADANDDAGTGERVAENGHGRKTQAEKEDERERKDEVDQVARDERAERTCIVSSSDKMERCHDKADDDDDGFAGQMECDHRALPDKTLR